NSVVFASGSTFIQKAGSNPFQKTAPASMVIFQSGSLFSLQQNSAPSLSGRTYANLEINNVAFNQNMTGTGLFTCDALTITAATLVGINLTGGVIINGDVTAASGTLSFTPASASTLT